jgi:hypothetical protein
MINFCVGLAIFLLLSRFKGKGMTISGLGGIIVFGLACYGTGYIVVELIGALHGLR